MTDRAHMPGYGMPPVLKLSLLLGAFGAVVSAVWATLGPVVGVALTAAVCLTVGVRVVQAARAEYGREVDGDA